MLMAMKYAEILIPLFTSRRTALHETGKLEEFIYTYTHGMDRNKPTKLNIISS